MNEVLAIECLCKSYDRFALRDISFSLPAGYIMGLIGPNGAGKTTIVKLILDLVRPESGAIRIFGVDHRQGGVAVRSRIGFVHEVPHFYEYLSLAALGSMVAPFYPGWNDAQFHSLVDRFGLPLRKSFGKLSRGQKMKFSLALALAHRAELIVLDEPTSGLDPASRQELLDLLAALIQDEKKSVLFSTHITSDLERIADFITFVRNGRLVFSSSREEVEARWRLVKGSRDFGPENPSWIKGMRKHDFGFEALTDNEAEARRSLGAEAVIEKASLEDIMFFLTRGGQDA